MAQRKDLVIIAEALQRVISLTEEIDLAPYMWRSRRGVPIISFQNLHLRDVNVIFFYKTRTYRAFVGRGKQQKFDFGTPEQVSSWLLTLAMTG